MKFRDAKIQGAFLLEGGGIEIAPGIKKIGEREYEVENCDDKSLSAIEDVGRVWGGREKVYIYDYTINGTLYSIYAFSKYNSEVGIAEIFRVKPGVKEPECLYLTLDGGHLVFNNKDTQGRGGKPIQDYDIVENSKFFSAVKEIVKDNLPETKLKRFQATNEDEDVEALKEKLKKGIDGYRWIHPGLATDGHYEEDYHGNAWNQKTQEIVQMLNKKGDDEYGIPLGYSTAWDLLIQDVMNPNTGWNIDTLDKAFDKITDDNLAGAMSRHMGIPKEMVEQLKKNTLLKQKAGIADKIVDKYKNENI